VYVWVYTYFHNIYIYIHTCVQIFTVYQDFWDLHYLSRHGPCFGPCFDCELLFTRWKLLVKSWWIGCIIHQWISMDFNGSTNYSPLRVGIDIPDITGTTDITDYRYILSFQLNIRFSPRQSFIHQGLSNFWAWPGFKLVASNWLLPYTHSHNHPSFLVRNKQVHTRKIILIYHTVVGYNPIWQQCQLKDSVLSILVNHVLRMLLRCCHNTPRVDWNLGISRYIDLFFKGCLSQMLMMNRK
jgi:hypothetical protein